MLRVEGIGLEFIPMIFPALYAFSGSIPGMLLCINQRFLPTRDSLISVNQGATSRNV